MQLNHVEEAWEEVSPLDGRPITWILCGALTLLFQGRLVGELIVTLLIFIASSGLIGGEDINN